MRKTAVIACALLLLLAASTYAAENDWRISMGASSSGTFGVAPSALDEVDSNDQLFQSMIEVYTYAMGTIYQPYDPYPTRYSKAINSPTSPAEYPGGIKRWPLIVGWTDLADQTPVTLRFRTLTPDWLPPQFVGGTRVGYRLVCTADYPCPLSGYSWEIPIPTSHSTSPYYTLPQTIPYAGSNKFYMFEFQQYVVPEPASLLALGSGLIGLAGSALRRRTS